MKLFVITKKHLIIASCLVVALTLSVVGATATFAQSNRKLPIYCVETDKKQIAISFDAAWGADDTQTLISVLKEYNVPATFFVVGAWVDKYPEAVKALSDAGHQVQNHSNTHPNMPRLSTAQMCDELKSCNDKIKAITGVEPTLFRPPYGDYNNATIDATESMGMKCIQWDVDSLDWKDNSTPDTIYQKVTGKVKNGSIVLFHNDAEHTPAALPNILKTLKEQGYEFVFIEDLIYKDNYQIIHDGTQCKIENN
ncbi:MAG: polysaccharide deacetylase family protein [Clostridia bacterium]|nr:polysaccharide deacetylase family protein [Clostridia bacterium]